MLPEAILVDAQKELLNWHNKGLSMLELGHRTPEFMDLLTHAELSLRELLNIPNHYHILFLGGPARTQFAMIPMNFLAPHEQAEYLVSGVWSQMAFKEAQLLKNAQEISSEYQGKFYTVPASDELKLKKNNTYLYYTPNETVNGIRFPYVPNARGLPLIADMTSSLLTEMIDINQYALIFAGAQKNIANAGLTLVIIRDDLLKKVPNPSVPTLFNYKIQAENRSLYATPPVFNCYLAAKMFDWVKNEGGVKALALQNRMKAETLYQYIDESNFYTATVSPEARSLVNVCFSICKPALELQFVESATRAGLINLKGHRLIGGLRASLYNAMPMEGVKALIQFMHAFHKDNS